MDLLDKIESIDSMTDSSFDSKFGLKSLEANFKQMSPEQKITQIGIQNKILNIKITENGR